MAYQISIRPEPDVKIESEMSILAMDSNPYSLRSARIPKVYFCTRTHSQIQQIVDEFKRCHPVYTAAANMCVLGSRTQYCINAGVKTMAKTEDVSLDELCREATKKGKRVRNVYCGFRDESRSLSIAANHLRSLRVWDIEDAIELGVDGKACPYYMTRNVAESASYFLSPYNYVLDPHIRHLLHVDLKDSIIIFDEAHNIEDVARDAASLDTKANLFAITIKDLKALQDAYPEMSINTDAIIQFLSGINHWLIGKVKHLHLNRAISTNRWKSIGKDSRPGQEFVGFGPEVLQEWAVSHGITIAGLTTFQDHLEKIEEFIQKLLEGSDEMNEAFGQEEASKAKKYGLPKSTMEFLRRLSYILGSMMQNANLYAVDYRIVIRKVENEDEFSNTRRRRSFHETKQAVLVAEGAMHEGNIDHYQLHFWCMSGRVVFEPILREARSVLLTSGTLSPMDSFEMELDAAFPIRVEANHVINLKRQLLVGIVHSFANMSFRSTYDCQQSNHYLDVVGDTLQAMIDRTPGGTLLFVPSYALLARLRQRWIHTKRMLSMSTTTGAMQIRNDNGRRNVHIYFEPKKSDDMKVMLEEYYDDLSVPGSKAAMVAVCRGKVSEGINFSDHYARTVMVLGIPFPSWGDLKVHLKMQYLDMKFSQQHNTSASEGTSRENITGRVWYKQQALRAVNQAIGRCIRHQKDFGCIVLLDPRFAEDNLIGLLSRWMRSEARVYEALEDFLPLMDSFFGPPSVMHETDVSSVAIPWPDSYHNLDKLNHERQEKLQRRATRQQKKIKSRMKIDDEEESDDDATLNSTKSSAKRRNEHIPLALDTSNDVFELKTEATEENSSSLPSPLQLPLPPPQFPNNDASRDLHSSPEKTKRFSTALAKASVVVQQNQFSPSSLRLPVNKEVVAEDVNDSSNAAMSEDDVYYLPIATTASTSDKMLMDEESDSKQAISLMNSSGKPSSYLEQSPVPASSTTALKWPHALPGSSPSRAPSVTHGYDRSDCCSNENRGWPIEVLNMVSQWHILPCPTSQFPRGTLSSYLWKLPKSLNALHSLFAAEYVSYNAGYSRSIFPAELTGVGVPASPPLLLQVGRCADISLTTLLTAHLQQQQQQQRSQEIKQWQVEEEWIADDGVVYRYLLYRTNPHPPSTFATGFTSSVPLTAISEMGTKEQVRLIAVEVIATTPESSMLQGQIFIHASVLAAMMNQLKTFTVVKVTEVTGTADALVCRNIE